MRELTAWEDPVRSTAVFAVGNAVFVLTAIGRWSAASLLGAAAFFALLGCASVTLLATLLSSVPAVSAMIDAAVHTLPAVLLPGGTLLDAELAADAGRLIAGAVNDGFGALRQLATVASPAATASALLGAYALKRLGEHVGLLGLSWAAFIAAFVVPIASSRYGEQLGDLATTLRVQVEDLREQATAFAAPLMANLVPADAQ